MNQGRIGSTKQGGPMKWEAASKIAQHQKVVTIEQTSEADKDNGYGDKLAYTIEHPGKIICGCDKHKEA